MPKGLWFVAGVAVGYWVVPKLTQKMAAGGRRG